MKLGTGEVCVDDITLTENGTSTDSFDFRGFISLFMNEQVRKVGGKHTKAIDVIKW